MPTNEETNVINETDLKRIYYENFIEELNEEELTYKKTVEDLFHMYKSFGLIYSIMKKGNYLLTKEKCDSFLKSVVSFIDELFLNSPNLFDTATASTTTTATNATSTTNETINSATNINKTNSTFSVTGNENVTKKRKIDLEDLDLTNKKKLTEETNKEPNSITNILCKAYIEDLLRDINSIDQNFSENNFVQDFLFILKNILKLKTSIAAEQVKNRFDKIKGILHMGKEIFDSDEFIDEENEGNKKSVREFVDEMCVKLDLIEPAMKAVIYKQNFWSKSILNKSEYDSLNSIFNLDVDAEKETVDKLYQEVLLLLSEKMTQDKDCLFAKEKLERLKNVYDAEIQRKLQQEMELSKKLEDKRKAVQFIIDRYNEYIWFDKNSPKKHSFYILGINPRIITEDQLKSFGKRLKHMLHPDKEPNKEWKEKAESAFKEASLAILGCQQDFKTKVLKHLEPGPLAPYLSLIGLEGHDAAAAAGAGGFSQADTNATKGGTGGQDPSVNGTSSSVHLPEYYPTKAYYPKFELKCVDQKVGTILIDIKCPLQLGVIKKVILYVHRPIYGDEPINLIPDDSFLSTKEEQNVNVKNLNQPIEVKVDYVQPLEIATSIKYYIGIQLIAERGNTMINWNSIHITLHKFSNKNIIKKLLSSFKNAPFINQVKLNTVLSNENKDEMAKLLTECIAQAKKWAQTV